MNSPESFPRPPFPGTRTGRTHWIRSLRPDLATARQQLSQDRPSHWLCEEEPQSDGGMLPTLTVFLTTSECPWTCLMCDLWRHASMDPVAPGAIPSQIDFAMEAARRGGFPGDGPRQIKLYNPGSFFDQRAVPSGDDEAIVRRVRSFDRLVVECHPALVGERCRRFGESLQPSTTLEVAMGLETAHPGVLAQLNKGITVDGFRRAADQLKSWKMDLRVFVLIQPPFLFRQDAEEWAIRSVETAYAAGATIVSLLPVRSGNGALEALRRSNGFETPDPELVDRVFASALAMRRGRVFLDLWDLPRWCPDPAVLAHWQDRWALMNRIQKEKDPQWQVP